MIDITTKEERAAKRKAVNAALAKCKELSDKIDAAMKFKGNEDTLKWLRVNYAKAQDELKAVQ